jgi:C4-dicarboxylate-specific signal transduction histidine kinase
MSERDEDLDSVRRDLTELATLSSAVTHVLINAFSAVVNTVEAAQLEPQELSTAELEGYSSRLIEACMKASEMARRFADVASLRAPLRITPQRVDRLAAESVERARSQSPAGVAWELDLSSTETVATDRAHVALVLDAVVRNAWEAVAEAGGRVVVRTCQDQKRGATIEIVDSGPGMPRHVLEHAFEPFFSTKPGHLGIGLSVSKALWRRLKGTLILEPGTPGGTIVRLSLMPAAPRPMPVAADVIGPAS